MSYDPSVASLVDSTWHAVLFLPSLYPDLYLISSTGMSEVYMLENSDAMRNVSQEGEQNELSSKRTKSGNNSEISYRSTRAKSRVTTATNINNNTPSNQIKARFTAPRFERKWLETQNWPENARDEHMYIEERQIQQHHPNQQNSIPQSQRQRTFRRKNNNQRHNNNNKVVNKLNQMSKTSQDELVSQVPSGPGKNVDNKKWFRERSNGSAPIKNNQYDGEFVQVKPKANQRRRGSRSKSQSSNIFSPSSASSSVSFASIAS